MVSTLLLCSGVDLESICNAFVIFVWVLQFPSISQKYIGRLPTFNPNLAQIGVSVIAESLLWDSGWL